MGKQIGLMIGGTPEPDDVVGMHVSMPSSPGVGVSVDVNKVNVILQDISSQISSVHPKATQIKQMVNDALSEKQPEIKFQKIKNIINFCADIAQIASSIYTLKSLVGF